MEDLSAADVTVRLRTGGPEDARTIATLRDASLGTYAQWAPPGWQAPVSDGPEIERLRTDLARPEVRCLVAESERGELEGFVAIKPLLTEWLTGDPVPGVANLWMLFVAPAAWRRGIGRRLHDAAVDEMRARGFERARLRAAEKATPARALYEHAGWRRVEHDVAQLLGIEMVLYELEL